MPSLTSFSRSQISHDDAMPYQWSASEALTGAELYTVEGEHVVTLEDYAAGELAVGVRKAERVKLKVLAANTVAVGDPLYLDTVNMVLTTATTSGILLAVAKEARAAAGSDTRVWVRFDSRLGQ